jgi:N-hydroxyarylamine O-acetyltransferase
MSEHPVDLDAYFARTGYAGSRRPDAATLRDLHWHHVSTIPFENWDVLMKRPIRIDPDSIQRKLVAGRRGGYCYEHNMLFMQVLAALGFSVMALAGRVLWGRADPALPPRTHMLLRVDLPEGPCLADVGFGGLTLPVPLILRSEIEQPTSLEAYRLAACGDEFDLQARLGSAWSALYRFSPQAYLPVDYEVPNWFVSTHPQSIFVQSLIAALPAADRRYALFNDEFTIRRRDGSSEQRIIGGLADLLEVLERCFSLTLPLEDRDALADLFGLWADAREAAGP